MVSACDVNRKGLIWQFAIIKLISFAIKYKIVPGIATIMMFYLFRKIAIFTSFLSWPNKDCTWQFWESVMLLDMIQSFIVKSEPASP